MEDSLKISLSDCISYLKQLKQEYLPIEIIIEIIIKLINFAKDFESSKIPVIPISLKNIILQYHSSTPEENFYNVEISFDIFEIDFLLENNFKENRIDLEEQISKNMINYIKNIGIIIYSCLTLTVQEEFFELDNLLKDKENFFKNIPYIPGLSSLISYFFKEESQISFFLNSDIYKT